MVATGENCGNSDGTITITASGGTGILEFSIDGGTTWQPANAFTGLAAGTYNVAVRDENLCVTNWAANPVTINSINGAAIDDVVATGETCGNSDGTITITATGGTGILEYSIDGGTTWQAANAFTGLAAGTYNVAVRDENLCVTTWAANPVTINSINGAAIDDVVATGENCGNSDGTITITATGGTGILEYSIDGGTTWLAANAFTGLAAGTYNVAVRDEALCVTLWINNPVVINNTGGATIDDVLATDATCANSDGTITITATGGTGILEFSIDGGTTWQAANAFTGLAAGTYNVAVRDEALCVTLWINNPVVINNTGGATIDDVLATDATCGNSDGTITITATGGTGILEYSIDGGTTWQAANAFTGLAAGTYNVAVRDEALCVTLWINNPVVINNTGGATIDDVLATDATCGNSDGTITITATGGTGILEFSIDGGTTWQAANAFTGLAAGTYNVAVRDEALCVTLWINNPVVINNTGGATIDDVLATDATCGNSDGTITITATGGTGILEFSIDGGTTWQAANAFTGLAAGTYNVAVRDEALCVTLWINNPVVINNTGGATIDDVLATDATCGNSDGTITITATGGTGILEYSIDGGTTWQAANAFTGLAAGTYNVAVRDEALCVTLWINNPVVINNTGGATIDDVLATDATCGNSDGTITITATGGTGILEYSIDGGTTWQAANAFTGLAAGTYNVAVRDEALCVTLWINNPVVINNTGGATIDDVLATDATCGNSDGTITITATGGTGILEYSIDGGTTWQAANAFTGLAAGTYNVAVRDEALCVTVWINNPVVINNTGGATIDDVLATDATCGNSDGTITITATGGTGILEYSIDGGTTWQAANAFTGLAAGTYNVAVRDEALCVTVWINNPVVINNTGGATIDDVLATDATCGNSDGTITITATGGTGTLEYSIDGGATWLASNSFTNLGVGSYDVFVRDQNLCETAWPNNPVIINSIGGATITNVVATDATCGNNDGTITITATGGTGTLEYSIDGGATWLASNSFTNLGVGSYDVFVRDQNLCETAWPNNPVIINSIGGATITNVVATDATCGNNDGTITITATGGTGTLEYSIDGGATWLASNSFTNLGVGSYDVFVRDQNLCETAWPNNPVIINSIGGATITNVVATDATCGNNDGTITITATGGTGTLEYSIDGGATWLASNSFTNLGVGSYDVFVRDQNLCETAWPNNPVIINSIGGATITNVVATDATCGNSDGTITITATGGTGIPRIQH